MREYGYQHIGDAMEKEKDEDGGCDETQNTFACTMVEYLCIYAKSYMTNAWKCANCDNINCNR